MGKRRLKSQRAAAAAAVLWVPSSCRNPCPPPAAKNRRRPTVPGLCLRGLCASQDPSPHVAPRGASHDGAALVSTACTPSPTALTTHAPSQPLSRVGVSLPRAAAAAGASLSTTQGQSSSVLPPAPLPERPEAKLGGTRGWPGSAGCARCLTWLRRAIGPSITSGARRAVPWAERVPRHL